MSDFIEDLIDNLGFFGLLIIIGLGCFGIVVGAQVVQIAFQPKVLVQVDGKDIFLGSKACVDVESAGAATQVSIKRGPLCLLPGETYTSKDVHVQTYQY